MELLADLARQTGKTIITTIHQPAKDEYEKFNLALILHAKGELETAETRLRAALALRPYMAKGWYYLGKVNAGAGRPAAAVAGYRRALESDPRSAEAHFMLGLVHLQKNRLPDARDALAQAIAIDPEALKEGTPIEISAAANRPSNSASASATATA